MSSSKSPDEPAGAAIEADWGTSWQVSLGAEYLLTDALVLRAGYASSFSGHGGNYTISVVPDEQYLQLLRQLREQITQRLFEERGTLSAEDVARLVQNLQDIENQIQKEAERGASCSGAAPDFSTVSAVISWSAAEGDWAINCGVVSYKA